MGKDIHNDKDKISIYEDSEDRRQYIRLNVVFPVEFQFLDPNTGGSVSDIKQGFTRDVGKGGICLEVNNIEEGFEGILQEKKAKLDLRLHIPLSHKEKKAVAIIVWHKKIKSGYPNKYIIGLSFVEIDPKERDRIYLHARKMILIPKIISVAVLFLITALIYFYATDFSLRRKNRLLVKELVEYSKMKSEFEKNIIKFDSENKETEEKLLENQKKVEEYEGKAGELERLTAEMKHKDELLQYFEQDTAKVKEKFKEVILEKRNLSQKASDLSKEAEYLRQRISGLSKESVSAEDSLQKLLSSFEHVEEKGVSSMYKWIKNHQNRFTGLVVSYEGDKDLEDWAFTYDQSLAGQCFILMGDQANAKDILDFYKFKAKKTYGGFTNAYDTYTGSVIEYTVHAGPNIWIGIAILQYTNRFKDEGYLSVAEDIADWLIEFQQEDSEFGIKGGPQFTWFSTEHNLDAYAFFGMLYKITQEEKYLIAQKRTFEWLKKNAFNKRNARLNRGKGDATIATDTFAWAIAALGPKTLKESGMGPDQIIDFAETNCVVTTNYRRPDGEDVEITGFDFGKFEHMPRGGVVSTEWTAQMVVTLKIMEEYHRGLSNHIKEIYYKRKADFYLSELQKMIIVSPSRVGQGEGCLPYVTQDNADTGHGWKAPAGARTGSAAGTAYTIFASRNYNPLAL
ncbi:MAG: PilZ domain-containing protein [Candidatus Omnitrophota bacterium]